MNDQFKRMKRAMTLQLSAEESTVFSRKLSRYCELHGRLISARSDVGPFMAAELGYWMISHYLDHNYLSIFTGPDCYVFVEDGTVWMRHPCFTRIIDELNAAMILEDLADA